MVDGTISLPEGILVGATRLGDLLKGKILAADAHLVIDLLLRLYAQNKQRDEIFSEFLARSFKERLLAGLPERYRAWGPELFGRGWASPELDLLTARFYLCGHE